MVKALNQPLTETQSTRSQLRYLWCYLNSFRRSQLGFLLVLMFFSGMAELLSLGAVVPFLAVLSAPDQLWEKPMVQAFAIRAGLIEPSQLLLPATVAFAMAAVLTAVVRLLNLRLNGRMAAAIGSDLSGEAFKRTLYQPYAVQLSLNSSTIITHITDSIARTTAAINSTLLMATSLVVTGGLLAGLLLIDWQVSLAAAILFVSAYLFIASVIQRETSGIGRKIINATSERLKTVQEGLGAIRDVLLEGNQPFYQEIYLKSDRCQRQLQAKSDFMAVFPRYGLEAMGIVSVSILGFILVGQKGTSSEAIPILGVMALGAQRLLPALQQLYASWAQLRFVNVDIAAVIDMLEQPLPPVINPSAPMDSIESISMRGVSFRYGPESPFVLNQLSIYIRKGERIGLIGCTGSGKSTAVDILMGLLSPTDGQLLINEEDLHDSRYPERLSSWQATISHVPQTIYLADTSIAENIAFGIPKDQIDMKRVRAAAAQAQISSFIEGLPGEYKSFVGERGIRLSGGQRQRIGIARALYKEAKVLFLDEATSALDNETERDVMDAISNLSDDLTVIIIAHRLSTVQSCDHVIRLVNGRSSQQ